jgi:predicted amidohydrolase
MNREDIGRPARIVSISFRNGKSLAEIVAAVDREAEQGADLIALPETWLGQKDAPPEPIDGPTIREMSLLARTHRTYIVCPIDRIDGDRRLNSAVVLDREGEVVAVYDKVYPYWSEFDLRPVVEVGEDTLVVETDFGRVGVAICFDVNFPAVWQRMADQGAELVIWPSAYSAGTMLQAYSLIHHFTIVSTTQTGDCQVYDITGERILDERSVDITVSRAMLDLDRGIYHENFNLAKRDQLLSEHGNDVALEQSLSREQWFVLKAKRPGISARSLAKCYGLEELRDYIMRSRCEIDNRRLTQPRNEQELVSV